jgi:hypothetical protein
MTRTLPDKLSEINVERIMAGKQDRGVTGFLSQEATAAVECVTMFVLFDPVA